MERLKSWYSEAAVTSKEAKHRSDAAIQTVSAQMRSRCCAQPQAEARRLQISSTLCATIAPWSANAAKNAQSPKVSRNAQKERVAMQKGCISGGAEARAGVGREIAGHGHRQGLVAQLGAR